MRALTLERAQRVCQRLFSSLLCSVITVSMVLSPSAAQAQALWALPQPGVMVQPSVAFQPVLIKGLTINPKQAFEFDFIVDAGDQLTDDRVKSSELVEEESHKLIRYFLAGLTIPSEDLWVNLSPYEEDRVIEDGLGKTELGRDMLAQDYLLKQFTSSLMHPDGELGQQFWNKVYQRALDEYGTTEIPVNTFHKVWIVPGEAAVYEHEQTGYVTKSTLKVMLAVDYEAERRSLAEGGLEHDYVAAQQTNDKRQMTNDHSAEPNGKSMVNGHVSVVGSDDLSSEIMRSIIIPEIEREVNQGEHFAPLRQLFSALILAKWYKQKIKSALLEQTYLGQNKINGVHIDDEAAAENIYARYVEAYKKGVFDFIRESGVDEAPRHYFSGGLDKFGDFVLAVGRAGDVADVTRGFNVKAGVGDGAMLTSAKWMSAKWMSEPLTNIGKILAAAQKRRDKVYKPNAGAEFLYRDKLQPLAKEVHDWVSLEKFISGQEGVTLESSFHKDLPLTLDAVRAVRQKYPQYKKVLETLEMIVASFIVKETRDPALAKARSSANQWVLEEARRRSKKIYKHASAAREKANKFIRLAPEKSGKLRAWLEEHAVQDNLLNHPLTAMYVIDKFRVIAKENKDQLILPELDVLELRLAWRALEYTEDAETFKEQVESQSTDTASERLYRDVHLTISSWARKRPLWDNQDYDAKELPRVITDNVDLSIQIIDQLIEYYKWTGYLRTKRALPVLRQRLTSDQNTSMIQRLQRLNFLGSRLKGKLRWPNWFASQKDTVVTIEKGVEHPVPLASGTVTFNLSVGDQVHSVTFSKARRAGAPLNIRFVDGVEKKIRDAVERSFKHAGLDLKVSNTNSGFTLVNQSNIALTVQKKDGAFLSDRKGDSAMIAFTREQKILAAASREIAESIKEGRWKSNIVTRQIIRGEVRRAWQNNFQQTVDDDIYLTTEDIYLLENWGEDLKLLFEVIEDLKSSRNFIKRMRVPPRLKKLQLIAASMIVVNSDSASPELKQMANHWILEEARYRSKRLYKKRGSALSKVVALSRTPIGSEKSNKLRVWIQENVVAAVPMIETVIYRLSRNQHVIENQTKLNRVNNFIDDSTIREAMVIYSGVNTAVSQWARGLFLDEGFDENLPDIIRDHPLVAMDVINKQRKIHEDAIIEVFDERLVKALDVLEIRVAWAALQAKSEPKVYAPRINERKLEDIREELARLSILKKRLSGELTNSYLPNKVKPKVQIDVDADFEDLEELNASQIMLSKIDRKIEALMKQQDVLLRRTPSAFSEKKSRGVVELSNRVPVRSIHVIEEELAASVTEERARLEGELAQLRKASGIDARETELEAVAEKFESLIQARANATADAVEAIERDMNEVLDRKISLGYEIARLRHTDRGDLPSLDGEIDWNPYPWGDDLEDDVSRANISTRRAIEVKVDVDAAAKDVEYWVDAWRNADTELMDIVEMNLHGALIRLVSLRHEFEQVRLRKEVVKIKVPTNETVEKKPAKAPVKDRSYFDVHAKFRAASAWAGRGLGVWRDRFGGDWRQTPSKSVVDRPVKPRTFVDVPGKARTFLAQGLSLLGDGFTFSWGFSQAPIALTKGAEHPVSLVSGGLVTLDLSAGDQVRSLTFSKQQRADAPLIVSDGKSEVRIRMNSPRKTFRQAGLDLIIINTRDGFTLINQHETTLTISQPGVDFDRSIVQAPRKKIILKRAKKGKPLAKGDEVPFVLSSGKSKTLTLNGAVEARDFRFTKSNRADAPLTVNDGEREIKIRMGSPRKSFRQVGLDLLIINTKSGFTLINKDDVVPTVLEKKDGAFVSNVSPVILDEKHSEVSAGPTGGIDISDLNVATEGSGVRIEIDRALLQRMMEPDFDGFAPVIYSITPLPSALPLLGLAPREDEFELA